MRVTPRNPSGGLGIGGAITSVVDNPTTVHAGRSNVTGLRADYVVTNGKGRSWNRRKPSGDLLENDRPQGCTWVTSSEVIYQDDSSEEGLS